MDISQATQDWMIRLLILFILYKVARLWWKET